MPPWSAQDLVSVLAARTVAGDPPGRDAARELVERELSRPEYDAARPPLLSRLIGRVLRSLAELLERAADAAPGGVLGLLALVLLLALIVAVVLTRLGPLARTSRPQGLLDGARTVSAGEHRALAEQAAAAGRYADAVRERMRAVATDLEARGALDPRAGRTAGEVARDGGLALPGAAADLRRGAELFDAIWYGGRTADAASYATLVEVDDRVVGAQLALA